MVWFGSNTSYANLYRQVTAVITLTPVVIIVGVSYHHRSRRMAGWHATGNTTTVEYATAERNGQPFNTQLLALVIIAANGT